jgi:peroxiredoxin
VKVQAEYGGEDFTVVGVTRGSADAGRRFIDELGATYPIVTHAGETFDAWGVTWIPQAYLVDPDGNVVADDLDAIDALLAEKL